MRSLILFHCQKTQKNDEFYPVNWLILTARHTASKVTCCPKTSLLLRPFKNGEKILNIYEITCCQVNWKKIRFSYLDFNVQCWHLSKWHSTWQITEAFDAKCMTHPCDVKPIKKLWKILRMNMMSMVYIIEQTSIHNIRHSCVYASIQIMQLHIIIIH